jgi:hypothetical protein
MQRETRFATQLNEFCNQVNLSVLIPTVKPTDSQVTGQFVHSPTVSARNGARVAGAQRSEALTVTRLLPP